MFSPDPPQASALIIFTNQERLEHDPNRTRINQNVCWTVPKTRWHTDLNRD